MRYTKHKYYVYMVLFLISFSYIYPQTMQDLQKMKAEYEKYQKAEKTAVAIRISIILFFFSIKYYNNYKC